MRVVVTGMVIVSPLGSGVNFVWKQLIQGKSGLRPLTGFETEDLACRVGKKGFCLRRGRSPQS